MQSVAAAAATKTDEFHCVAAINRSFGIKHACGRAQGGLTLVHGSADDCPQGLSRFDGYGLAVDKQGS